jgi:hypothetical protein
MFSCVISRRVSLSRRHLTLAGAWLIAACVSSIAPALGKDPEFGSYWHDGKAEIDGYRLAVSRYGQTREGTCVMIYVTEPFSESKRVKADDPGANPTDTFDALKLNIVRDFQTGIYDYNTMVSLFVRTSDFSPVKITFTSAEWCGHVYEELLFDREEIAGRFFSYFEDESGEQSLKMVDGGIAEDNLFVLLRSLRRDFLKPGASVNVKYISGAYYRRLFHEPLVWEDATISRFAKTERVDAPAGTFEAVVYEIAISGGRSGKFFVEKDYPHRIVRWELSPDIRGELTGSTRLQYWKLNENGDESYLEEIGLR